MNRTHLTKKAILLADPAEQNLHDQTLLAGLILPVKSYLAWMKKAQNLLVLLMILILCVFFPSCQSDLPKGGGDADGDVPQPTEITFTTEGASFAPVIIVTGNPTIKWTWNDGTISNSSTPTKNYGSAGHRINKLVVTPWSAVQRINIGYVFGDQGSYDIERVEDQKVSSVTGLSLVAPYLIHWCSSYNLIESLDFTNFSKLEKIECFNSQSLKHIKLTGTIALKRACFEDNALQELDLSGCPNFEDLRGALNNFTTINYGSIGSKIWHICIRENSMLTNDSMFSNTQRFPNLSELLLWQDNQKGKLDLSNKKLLSGIYAWNNNYTTVDFSNSVFKPLNSPDENVNLNYNKLENLILTNCTGITSLRASHNNLSNVNISSVKTFKILDLSWNRLSESSVESILRVLDLSGVTGTIVGGQSDCMVDLSGGNNAGINANAQIYAANLIRKNWTVTTNAPISGGTRVDFSTTGDNTTMRCTFSSDATASWHWSNGTITPAVSGAEVAISGLGAGVHSHYLVIDHGSSLTLFGGGSNYGNGGVGHLTSINGLNGCTSLNILYVYNESALTSVGRVNSTKIKEYHIKATALSATVMDQIFADAVGTGVTAGTLYYNNLGTSASDANRATLLSRGWQLY